MELVEFLRARYDDDRNRADALHALAAAMPAPETADWLRDLADQMLREVEAKRRIVDYIAGLRYDGQVKDWEWLRWADPVLQAQALPYDSHPAYRDAWRP